MQLKTGMFIGAFVFLVMPFNLCAQVKQDLLFFGINGQCPFQVTNGPKTVDQIKLILYNDTACGLYNNQYTFYPNDNHSVVFYDGFYSFAPNSPYGSALVCQQQPMPYSFTLGQMVAGVVVSTSTCISLNATNPCSNVSGQAVMNCTNVGVLILQ